MMNDDVVKQLLARVKPYQNMIHDMMSKMHPTLIALENTRKQYEPIMKQASTAMNAWVNQNKHVLENIRRYSELAQEWQEHEKQNVTMMAKNGWFPNWNTFYFKSSNKKHNDIDELMTEHLTECWGDLTHKILELCPNRAHIIRAAIKLHEEENYIASIPLFISQADGIFCEEIKTFLFAGEKPKETLDKMLETGELQRGFFEDILLEPYMIKTQFSEGIRKSGLNDKKKAPNRNGILHGHRKHLDYGNKLNSLKSFSLLAFVVFSVKDVFKKE